MKFFICQECGHVTLEDPLEKCPACGGTAFREDQFAVHSLKQEGREKHVSVISVDPDSLQAPGKCTDIDISEGSVFYP